MGEREGGMSAVTLILLTAASCLATSAIILSLVFKNAYLYRKLQNRLTDEEMEKVNAVQNHFWSFLK